MKTSFSLLVLCALIGCDHLTQSQSNSPGLQVTLAKCETQGPASKIQADTSKAGELIHRSSDSISFRIKASLLCVAQYAFSTAIVSPDTLTLKAIDIGDTRSKCVCEKEMTIEIKAMNNENFSGIIAVKFSSQIYSLLPN